MLKGSYTAITVSVLLHLILLFVLIYSFKNAPKASKQEKIKVKNTIIKSFLYSVPKKTLAKKVAPKKDIMVKSVAEKIIVAQKLAQKPTVKKTPLGKATTKALPTQVTNAVKIDSMTIKNKVAAVSRGNSSSYDRLSQLRKNLANQQRDKAFSELTQKRSAAIMHGDPFPVPKTLVPLTAEQQHKRNTSTSHVGSITKNDNGTCTMQREQILGSPVEASTAYFSCGESKFDKSFREHMQKVQTKLGIKR
ncbi:hypothetical protein [Colwellia piezophila]|uniref:hypothetical protein n=1 Tax=Colwellia piezophila TaxID=211668 RepID=UPI000372203C|nr:hypothetical protein [Colwellia piezophila]